MVKRCIGKAVGMRKLKAMQCMHNMLFSGHNLPPQLAKFEGFAGVEHADNSRRE